MNISSDYFLLYHGLLEVQMSQDFALNQALSREHFLELASLFLSTHRKNINHFSSLDYFKELSLKLSPKAIITKDDLYTLQSNILYQLQSNISHEDLEILDKAFCFLHDSSVLSMQQYEKLHTLFNPSLLKSKQEPTPLKSKIIIHDFLEQKEIFLKDIQELKENSSSDIFCSQLDKTIDYIHMQGFSIGITGVMNAGKSTLLNALMGEEVLGSSVIPETANLSIVSYCATPFAVVHYWNTNEWQSLEKSAENLPSMRKFIDETNLACDGHLHEYVTQVSKQTEIAIADLSLYTSAAKSNGKCNLVKYVELGVNLDFLSDGIEIVDTPGLDDPVVQREEITKEYMSGCDLMIHLMNVSQSATLKDVEFIIDALLYQNVSALLVIITRADTVSSTQLDEVIAYTKRSIKEQLSAINQDNKLDFIFEALSFLSVSGYMALQHRTGKSHHAIQAGFPLEKTGILEVEAYLNKTLFGSNSSKNKLLIHGIHIRIKRAIKQEIEALHYELTLLTKSSTELETELQRFKEQKTTHEKQLQLLQSDIKIQKEQLLEYVHSLDSFIISALQKLQAVIKNRLLDDVKYNLETEKKALQEAHVKNILLTALKDGIIDIIRDYRYKCLKKMDNISVHIINKYQKSELTINASSNDIDVSDIFKETFSSNFLSTNYDQLVKLVFELLHKAKLKKIDQTSHDLEAILSEHISLLQTSITQKAQQLTKQLLADFFQHLQEPLTLLQTKLETEEHMITRHLNSVESNEEKKEKQALQTHQTINELKSRLLGYE